MTSILAHFSPDKQSRLSHPREARCNLLFTIAVTILYCGFMFILFRYHEPWRDEAQAWLIARDCSFLQLPAQLRVEGHPALWFWLLMPLAKLGLPMGSMFFLNGAIMAASAFLLLRYAPFHPCIRLCLLCSSPFLYSYSVLWRSYCLVALLVIWICVSWRKRFVHPFRFTLPIALLCVTHVHMLGFAGALLLVYALEWILCRPHSAKLPVLLAAAVIPVLAAFFTFLVLRGGTDVNNMIHKKDLFANGLSALWEAAYPLYKSILGRFGVSSRILMFFIPLAGLCITFTFPKQGFCLFAGCTFQFLLQLLVYRGHNLHDYIYLFYLLFAIWTLRQEQPHPLRLHFAKRLSSRLCMPRKKLSSYITRFAAVLIAVAALGSAAAGESYILEDVQKSKSSARALGQYIAANLPKDCIIVTVSPDFLVTSAIPYLVSQQCFWNPHTQDRFTFVDWSNPLRDKALDRAELEQILAAFPPNTPLYLLERPENRNVKGMEDYFKDQTALAVFGGPGSAVVSTEHNFRLYLYQPE